MAGRLGLAIAALVAALAAPAAATAAPVLELSASHQPSHVQPGMVAARLTVTVSNAGTDPTSGTVTVTDTLPAGVTATVAAGDGWSCSGAATRTCTRADALDPGDSYPPVTIVANVGAGVAAELVNRASVSGGGDPSGAADDDVIPARDACPNGWAPEQTVSFAPPFRPGRPGGIDSGVVNPERADGCTLLDVVWEAEPFDTHAAFLRALDRESDRFVAAGLLTRREQRDIRSAAARSDVGRRGDHQVDNSCENRIAFTFDDGTSFYRPQTLQVLREEQVHANFFDNGFRVAANPEWAAFQVREGHVELNHTYNHVHMDQLSDAANREEVLRNEELLAAIGAPLSFKGIRPPFGGSNPGVQRLLTELGYTYFLNRIDASDWLPERTPEQIRDRILEQLRPGVIIALHDGPADTSGGPATVKALRMIIDAARERGYCFGVLDASGQVVADRYVSSGERIPSVVNPVPYRPLVFGSEDDLPDPWVMTQSPDLRITAAHRPRELLRADAPNTTVYAGALELTVTNRGDEPTDGSAVTVADALPAGLSPLTNNPGLGAGVVAASGDGWSCTADATCTRSDVLAPGASYPPIAISVRVASNAPARVVNSATVTGGGDATAATDQDAIPIAADACPNGWSPDETVAFGPPAPAIDSGVRNRQRPDGCTLLDVIWAAEPFASHGEFEAAVRAATRDFRDLFSPRSVRAIRAAARRSDVGTRRDRQIDDSCLRRIAISLDDGPSFYRPQTLALFRDKQVTGTLFDVAVRVQANPQLDRFAVREGHVVLNHTFLHPHLDQLPLALVRDEILDAEAAFAAAGAPLAFKGVRPPFFGTGRAVDELITTLGYTSFTARIETEDYEPDSTAQQIADAIVEQLRPGAIIVLHDGPIDTPAGAATEAALGQIIDRARRLGYCFGKLDRTGQVVGSRHVSTSRPIPRITAPVPYLPLVREGQPPEPFTTVPQPLAIAATHSPAAFTRGDRGATLSLTVTNRGAKPTDGSTITVRDRIPAGLTATAASGSGWTCTGTGTRTCTRSDVLAPGASYPPIAISVDVAADAPAAIANTATVTGHGGNVWVASTTDRIEVR